MEIEIDGLKELSDRLASMPAKAAKRYLSRAGEAAATVVAEALKESAPVQVGILEESIVSKKEWLDGDETVMEISVGPTKQAFWGSFQEFGTQEVSGVDKNGEPFHHAAQPAQHWMGRAWEGCKEEALDAFATEAIGILQDLENKG
ncbi:MAG TPA: HK97-gp10 family putative phage morphogenesis protein [Terriglobales bacterium]|jgi:HK97 gp10 family phage protein|nr:HK97-gp10 family putative phage morphogenesis protein [Terriglobales bacterium]